MEPATGAVSVCDGVGGFSLLSLPRRYPAMVPRRPMTGAICVSLYPATTRNTVMTMRSPPLDRLVGRPVLSEYGATHADSASARARRSVAPSPRQALPCMHASVAGRVAASRSSIPRACFVWEK